MFVKLTYTFMHDVRSSEAVL